MVMELSGAMSSSADVWNAMKRRAARKPATSWQMAKTTPSAILVFFMKTMARLTAGLRWQPEMSLPM